MIDFPKRVEVYESAIARFGMLLQAVVAIEELSEVQKEICKFLRGKNNREQLAEEVADATIMLEQLRVMFNMDDAVSRYMDEKVKRLAERVKGGE